MFLLILCLCFIQNCAPITATSILYRPLDRSRNEIRLLKIFPPEPQTHPPDTLDFAPDIVRYEVQNEGLDKICEKKVDARKTINEVLDYIFMGPDRFEPVKDEDSSLNYPEEVSLSP
jgi:hypothetical protein